MNNLDFADFYKGKKVLITGDTGFKGSWLAYWLNLLGAEVIGYALPPENDLFNILNLTDHITHVDGDLLDLEKLNATFQQHQPEVVFHLAAQALVRLSYDEPKLTFDTNVGGSVNMMEAVRHCKSVRSVIYVTSDKCYKNKEWVYGYRETDELGGHDPYSASKAAAEIVFSSYRDSFFKENKNIGLASVRAGNVIGGGDWAKDRIVPDCMKALENNEKIKIRNPLSTRPWQHVLEPLSGYMLLAMKQYHEPIKFSGSWNFGPDHTAIKTVEELAHTIIKNYGSGSLHINTNDSQKHEASLLHLNCDKTNFELQWQPTWSFEDTIKHTVEWYIGLNEGEDPRKLTEQNILTFSDNARSN
ncbi:MAG: CDP-glucose 4,6-dehydratase [Reichenbachiella sp.]|uniref:CDP-glucose 4,6-dehydratase n=1 Tax=Reichenbachiella sp. TaxID=2184521 RepID=UPI0032969EAA